MMGEPLTMDEGAIGIHEMYIAYMRAGFDKDQAFELVKIVMISSLGKQERQN